MTNEQTIVDVERILAEKKQKYIDFLNSLVLKNKITKKDFLSCQQLGNDYFNYAEEFVGKSGLLGAHKNGLWVTGFAETCSSILEVYIVHIKFLRSHVNDMQIELSCIEPNINAYASMQRMVVEYLPPIYSNQLKEKFIDENLPITGFEHKAVKDEGLSSKWKEILAIAISLLLLLIIIYFTIKIPHPTTFQIFIFRGVFALSLALLTFLIPGLLNVESKFNQVKIKATGAIAVLIIIWFVNPPALIN